MADVLTWSEAARRLDESPHAIRGAVKAKGWPAVRVGNAYVLTPEQFEELRKAFGSHSRPAA